jgi:HlyD family secretion protein
MRTFIRILLVVVVVGAAAAGFWWYRSHNAPASTSGSSGGSSSSSRTFTQIVAAKKGSLSSNLTVVGQLEAVQSADLTFSRMSGTAKLATLAIKAGNTITSGQVLGTIDPTSYQQALDQANSTLAAAQKKLADLKTPPTDLELAQADLAIAQADVKLKQAQDTLDKLVNPDWASLNSAVADAQSALASAQSNVVAQQTSKATTDQLTKLQTAEATPAATYSRLTAETYSDAYYQDRLQAAYNKMMDTQDARVTFELQQQANLTKAQLQVRKTQDALKTAQDALNTAHAGGDPVELANDKLAVHSAQVDQLKAKSDKETLLAGTDAATLASAQSDVDRAQLAVNNAQADLDATKLVAPFDGTVLKVNYNPGDLISSNALILSLADLKNLQVAAAVDETTIRRVSTGQNVNITFDAFPGQRFKGKVLEVPLDGTLQGGVMVYNVPISLIGAEKLPLRVGMTANTQIQVGSVANALLVPAMAIQRSNGTYQVQVVDPADPKGTPQTVPVQIGLSDGTNTQITGGLNEGDQVVVEMSTGTSTNFFGFPGGGGGPPPGGGNRNGG